MLCYKFVFIMERNLLKKKDENHFRNEVKKCSIHTSLNNLQIQISSLNMARAMSERTKSCYQLIPTDRAQKSNLYWDLKYILIKESEKKFIEFIEEKLCPKLIITKILQDKNVLKNEEIINPYLRNEIKKLYKTEEEVERDWTKTALKEYLDVLLEMFLYDYGLLSFEHTIPNSNNDNQSNNNLNKEQMEERKIEIINVISKWESYFNGKQLLRNDFIVKLLVTVKIWKTEMFL